MRLAQWFLDIFFDGLAVLSDLPIFIGFPLTLIYLFTFGPFVLSVVFLVSVFYLLPFAVCVYGIYKIVEWVG